MSSPFERIPRNKWIAENELAFAIRDEFPVSAGHSLVVTKRLVATWFQATAREQSALMQLVTEVKTVLDETLSPKPDGYNVGFNCGDAAGQTVPHLHIHVIPRYHGDMKDPRGGVRHVIPSKANYLRGPSGPDGEASGNGVVLSTGHPSTPLWEHLAWRLAGARKVDILSAFVQLSGLDVIEDRLFDALRNDARIRILVSDYLYISDVRALRRLLGWSILSADQFGDECLSVRLIECERIPSQPASFHPKAWQISDDDDAIIAVGSSNLSGPALKTGVEWNLLSTRESAPAAHQRMADEFSKLWQVSSELTPALIDSYAERASAYRADHFQPEIKDTREPLFEPRPWQLEALGSLQRIRDAGYKRALVAVATGMGKTWLAAFDARQLGVGNDRRPAVLVIAHRAHILVQSEAALSRVLDSEFGDGATAWYLGSSSELSGELVVASVQKPSRPNGLKQIAARRFDYVVIDEVHHAHAPSYRKVLAQLQADFILGLTATPERADGYDVATIFDDNLAHHATIGDGIDEESLVPFHYIGLRDTVDFTQIPWRNGRFDLEELERRVAKSERMERLATALEEHPGDRTIVFCCSQRHAVFTRDWLRGRDQSAAAVFAGVDSNNYSGSLSAFRDGRLSFLCVVDMFNEGLDIPAVDRVVMLRPTESKVVFLQQLGRGLRASDGKSHLLVIDFVGNHRVFAQRMIHLLSLTSTTAGWKELKNWLNGDPPELPTGCLLDVELDAKDILKQFLPRGKEAGIEGYRALRDELGRRPTMTEVYSRGFLPKTMSASEGSWFPFCASEGDLSNAEHSASQEFGDWLRTVETTSLNKSYKMVVLRVLLDQGALFERVDLQSFALACRRFMQNHEVLRRDLEGQRHAVDHDTASNEDWVAWWIKWPISRWLDEQNGRKWFTRSGDNFGLNLDCGPETSATLENMTEEIVEYRLAHYSRSRRLVENDPGERAFDAKVSHANGRTILFVPEKSKNPNRPVGLTSVVLPDGSEWEFKFVKVACKVAYPKGDTGNRLSELLRSWYGPNAGLPGTDFTVRFKTKEGVWHLSPNSERVVEEPVEAVADRDEPAIVLSVKISEQYRTHAPVYNIKAAAGKWGPEGIPEIVGWVPVSDQRLGEGIFAARVLGKSMEPRIKSGSLCLFRPCPSGSREGRLLLVQVNTHLDPVEGGRYMVKRYHSVKQRSPEGWEHKHIELQPLNPDFANIAVRPEDVDSLRIVGEFVTTL